MTTASSVNLPGVQTTNISPTISNAFGQIAGLGSTYGGVGTSALGTAEGVASNLVNNPYASQAQAGAGQAASLGNTAALAGYGIGQSLAGAGGSLVPYASSIMQAGFDPQQALYNQQFALNNQQANVTNAQSGVATTPYGAGVVDQSNQNFNTNWQNQQLAREAQAASAAAGLVSTGSAVESAGAGLMNAAPGQLVQSATIPYATYSDIGTGQNQALSQLLGIGQSGANLSNMSITDLLSLLRAQNQTNSVGNQAGANQLSQANSQFNQEGTLASGAAGILGMFL